jgi:GH25 family lysozyme M1 (1,4-beta-N-acetylmuramidase)
MVKSIESGRPNMVDDWVDGVDVSKWQGTMDWKVCKQAGARFAFVRAGSIDNVTGQCYTDYKFVENQKALQYMPTGFYWYFRPNHDPVKQADYFSNLIEYVDWKLRPVMDLETSGGLRPRMVTERAAEFVTRLNESLGVLPILYSRGFWLNDNTVTDPLMQLLELWIARYTFKGKPWGNVLPYPDNPRIKPRDYDTWVFWQWSADGNNQGPKYGASSKSIDLNRFNGNEGQFAAYVNANVPNPRKFYIVSDNTGAVIVDAPEGNKVGLLPYGTFLYSEEEPGTWIKVGGGYVDSNYLKEVT